MRRVWEPGGWESRKETCSLRLSDTSLQGPYMTGTGPGTAQGRDSYAQDWSAASHTLFSPLTTL